MQTTLQSDNTAGPRREQQPCSASRFVSDYADAHLYEEGNPRGLCAGCEHYRPADGGDVDDEANEDWCWLKEGKYADGRESECPAWISSQNTKVSHGA